MGQAESSETSTLRADERHEIARDKLFNLIARDKTTVFMLERQLRQVISGQVIQPSHSSTSKHNAVSAVVCSRNLEGRTMLHCAVLNGRTDLLAAFFRTGCWSRLYHKKIKTKTAFFDGLTALAIAQQRHQKDCLSELQRLEEWENTLNDIHRAARDGDVDALKTLLHGNKLARLRQLYDTDSMECTTLYWGCVSGNMEMVQLLMVEWGMDARVVNKQGETLLHVACQLGHYQLVPVLHKSFKGSLAIKDSNGLTPADHIVCNDDDQSFQHLTRCDLQPNELCNIILMSAAQGRTHFIEFLVTVLNVDPRITNDVGLNALTCAVFNGQVGVVGYLLGLESIDVRTVGPRRRNVLHAAVGSASPNRAVILDMILKVITRRNPDNCRRAIINCQDSYFGFDLCRLVPPDVGRSQLQDTENTVRIVEVHRGLVCLFDRRIMHVEGEFGNEDGEVEGNIEDLGRFGKVHCSPGNDESAEWKSLEKKFLLAVRDNPLPDMTPLHLAVYQTPILLEAIEALLQHGADPNIPDSFGLTPLHVAAMRGFVPVVVSLVRRGADLAALDNLGKTALDVARDNKHSVVVKFLSDVNNMTLNEALDIPDLKLNELPFNCLVCLNDIRRHRGVCPKLCRHFICRICLAGRIMSQTTVEISCPVVSCEAVLLHREIRQIVSNVEYDKLLERSVKVGEMSAGKSAHHCKTFNCNYWVIVDIDSNGSCRCQQFECQLCHKVNCINCDVIHEGSTCSQFQEQRQRQLFNNEAKNVTEIERLVQQREAMLCPRCGHAIIKDGGCSSMTCRCGQKFIWNIGTNLTRILRRDVGDTIYYGLGGLVYADDDGS